MDTHEKHPLQLVLLLVEAPYFSNFPSSWWRCRTSPTCPPLGVGAVLPQLVLLMVEALY